MNIRRSIDPRVFALLFLAALPPLSSACGSDADPAEDPGDVVGTWRYTGDDGTSGESWELSAGGAFRYERTAQDSSVTVVEGDYSVEEGTIHLDGEYGSGATITSDMTYHAGPDRASIPAYVADGDHDGWVGSWTMRAHNLVREDGEADSRSGAEERVDLRADGSAVWSITYDDGADPQLVTGTWTEGDATIELDGTIDGSPFPWSFPTLGDEALGQFVLQRVE